MLWNSLFLFFGVKMMKHSNFGHYSSPVGEFDITVPENNNIDKEKPTKQNTYDSFKLKEFSKDFLGQDCRYELSDKKSLSDWALGIESFDQNTLDHNATTETPAQRMEKNFKKFAILTELGSSQSLESQKLALINREYSLIFGEPQTYGISTQSLYRGMEEFL